MAKSLAAKSIPNPPERSGLARMVLVMVLAPLLVAAVIGVFKYFVDDIRYKEGLKHEIAELQDSRNQMEKKMDSAPLNHDANECKETPVHKRHRPPKRQLKHSVPVSANHPGKSSNARPMPSLVDYPRESP